MANGESKSENISFINHIVKKIINGETLNDLKLTNYIFMSFICVGIFTHLFFSNVYSTHGNYGPASALIWGYSIVLLSIFSLLFLQQTNSSSVNVSLKDIPVDNIILMVLILWIITINVKNSKKINSRKVPNNFYSYSWSTTILIMLQLVIFVLKMTILSDSSSNNSLFKDFSTVMSNINFISYLLLTLIFILIIIQQIILDNFSVDVL